MKEGIYETECAKRRIETLKESIRICQNVLKNNFNICFFEFTRTNVHVDDCFGDQTWTKAKLSDDDDLRLCIYGAFPSTEIDTTEYVNQEYVPFMHSYIHNPEPLKNFEPTQHEFQSDSCSGGKVTYSTPYYVISEQELSKYFKQGIVCGLSLERKRTRMTRKKMNERLESKEYVQKLLEKFKQEKTDCENIIKKFKENGKH